jgi:hypothetical protein
MIRLPLTLLLAILHSGCAMDVSDYDGQPDAQPTLANCPAQADALPFG